MNEQGNTYVSPLVEVLEVAVEHGMEMSVTANNPGGYELGEWD